MNVDGRPGIDVGADLGACMPAVLGIAIGFLAASGLLAGGALLIVQARFPRARTPRFEPEGEVMSNTSISVPPRVHWRAGKKKLIAIKR